MKKQSLALAKTTGTELIPRRDLRPEDVSDASLTTLERATVLAFPAAQAVIQALASIKGRPVGDRILVLPLPKDDHFGSIIIPNNAQEEQQCGIVVSVGKGRYENGVLIPTEVQQGNYVMFSKYAARTLKIGNMEVFQIAEQDITFAAGE